MPYVMETETNIDDLREFAICIFIKIHTNSNDNVSDYVGFLNKMQNLLPAVVKNKKLCVRNEFCNVSAD